MCTRLAISHFSKQMKHSKKFFVYSAVVHGCVSKKKKSRKHLRDLLRKKLHSRVIFLPISFSIVHSLIDSCQKEIRKRKAKEKERLMASSLAALMYLTNRTVRRKKNDRVYMCWSWGVRGQCEL